MEYKISGTSWLCARIPNTDSWTPVFKLSKEQIADVRRVERMTAAGSSTPASILGATTLGDLLRDKMVRDAAKSPKPTVKRVAAPPPVWFVEGAIVYYGVNRYDKFTVQNIDSAGMCELWLTGASIAKSIPFTMLAPVRGDDWFREGAKVRLRHNSAQIYTIKLIKGDNCDLSHNGQLSMLGVHKSCLYRV
jgi:hypothetical protein